MYVVVRQHGDLERLRQLKDRRNILIRFMMNGCSHCIASQPEWDGVVGYAKDKLDTRDAIAEVESNFVGQFKDFMRKERPHQLPDVHGFPTIVLMTRHGSKTHESRDKKSLIHLLKQVESIPEKSPTSTRKKHRRHTRRSPKLVPKLLEGPRSRSRRSVSSRQPTPFKDPRFDLVKQES